MDVDPGNFQRQIDMKRRAIYAAYDIPWEEVTTDISGSRSEPVGQSSWEAMTERRFEQVNFARAFDRRLLAKSIKIARKLGWPDADDLPTDDEFEDGYKADFGQVSRSFADPDKDTAYQDWLIRHGGMSVVDAVGRTHPNTPRAKIMELIKRNVAEQAEFNELVASRNVVTTEPDTMENSGAGGDTVRNAPIPGTLSAAQVNGAAGVLVRRRNQAADAAEESNERNRNN